MTFSSTVTTTSYSEGHVSYRITLDTSWEPSDGLDPVAVYGNLELTVSGGISVDSLVEPEADSRVQELVDRLTQALEGSRWSMQSKKFLQAYQTITPDETDPTA